MIHEKELSIVEVNERRNKLIDVSVTDSLQQKVRSKLPRIKKKDSITEGFRVCCGVFIFR